MHTKKSILLIILLLFIAPFTYSDNQNISLAELYPKEKLESILLSQKDFFPFPKIENRDSWNQLPEYVKQAILSEAEEYLDKDVPALPATLYLEFKRIGNRSNYQSVWFERRTMIHYFTLAECIENEGRFLDPLTDVLWAVCEESSWTFPAHIGRQKAGVDLPDTTEPIVALFSAETASTLAWTAHLIGKKLDTVSPLIVPRIQREIDERILTPYLERDDFGWMGFGSGRRPNNWNPWINSNVLTSTLLGEDNDERRIELIHKILRSLDNFLVPYPSDGSCDEGPSYWGHAGGSLYDNLEILYLATNGQFDVFDENIIQEIGKFIYRTHIADQYFINVGDCDPIISIKRDLVYRYGKRINDQAMMDFAAYQVTENSIHNSITKQRYFGRLLFAVFNAAELLNAKSDTRPWLRDVWLGDQDMELMAARDQGSTTDGFFLAAFGAHNGQSHNHNDVGNFIIYYDGTPFLIDVGRPTYTRQTFSGRRYEIWAFQSAFHNLPTINGVMQKAGGQYRATDIHYHSNDAQAQLNMDIAQAYPDSANVDTWKRTVRLNRGKNVEIIDDFTLHQTSDNIEENLITPCEVQIKQEGVISITNRSTSKTLQLHFDPDQCEAILEEVHIEDGKLKSIWGEQIYRIQLKTLESKTQDTIKMRFTE